MVLAGNLKIGMVIKQDGDLYRIIDSATHVGGGKTARMVHTRVKNLLTGHIREWRLHTEDKLQDVVLERQELEFLYSDENNLFFMHPETFEQIPLPKEMIGNHEEYLLPAMVLQVEYFEGKPIHINFPQTVELRVVFAPPAVREHDSATYKTITLENGMKILAPQFIKEGESVKVDVETGKYQERSHL